MMRTYEIIFRSFEYAFCGLRRLLAERNMRIHLGAFTAATIAGLFLHLSTYEWIAVIFVSMTVMSAEAFNTALEILCDKVCDSYDSRIKLVKDVSAAGVLITAIIALITAAIIFIPKIMMITL